MVKKIVLTAIAVAIVIGAVVYAKLGQFTAMGEAAENMALPPETVTAMAVEETQWEQVISATATVSAVQGVTVSAEIGGRVTEIAFESGTAVEAGDRLLQLDTSSETAQLAAAEAALRSPGPMLRVCVSWVSAIWRLTMRWTGPRRCSRRQSPRSA